MNFRPSKGLASVWKNSSYISTVWFKPTNTSRNRIYLFDKKVQVWGSELGGANSSFETMKFLSQRVFYRLSAFILCSLLGILLSFSIILNFSLVSNLVSEIIFNELFLILTSFLAILTYIYCLSVVKYSIIVLLLIWFPTLTLYFLYCTYVLSHTKLSKFGYSKIFRVHSSTTELHQINISNTLLNYKVIDQFNQMQQNSNLLEPKNFYTNINSFDLNLFNKILIFRSDSKLLSSILWPNLEFSIANQVKLTRVLQTAWARNLETNNLKADSLKDTKSSLKANFEPSGIILPSIKNLTTLNNSSLLKTPISNLDQIKRSSNIQTKSLNSRLWCVQGLDSWSPINFNTGFKSSNSKRFKNVLK